MNKDQMKGTAKDLAGKMQREVGKATGNTTQEAKGIKNQMSGKVQKTVGNIKEGVKNATRDTRAR